SCRPSLRSPGLRLYSVSIPYCQLLMCYFMPIMQQTVVPPISAVNSPVERVNSAVARQAATASKPFISNDYPPQKRRFSGAKPIFSLRSGEFRAVRCCPTPEGPTALLRPRPPSQHLDPQRLRRTEPECEAGVVGDAVIGERMHQDVQTLTIEHQPRNQGRKLLRREGHLIHRDGMRSDRLVMPAS